MASQQETNRSTCHRCQGSHGLPAVRPDRRQRPPHPKLLTDVFIQDANIARRNRGASIYSEQMQRGTKAASSLIRLGAKSCSAKDHKSSSKLFSLCKVSLVSWTSHVKARMQDLTLSLALQIPLGNKVSRCKRLR